MCKKVYDMMMFLLFTTVDRNRVSKTQKRQNFCRFRNTLSKENFSLVARTTTFPNRVLVCFIIIIRFFCLIDDHPSSKNVFDIFGLNELSRARRWLVILLGVENFLSFGCFFVVHMNFFDTPTYIRLPPRGLVLHKFIREL